MENLKSYLDGIAKECNGLNTEPTNTLLGEFNRGRAMAMLSIYKELLTIFNELNEEQKRAYYKTGDIISFLAGAKMDIFSGGRLDADEFRKALNIMYEIQMLLKPSFEKIEL